MLITFGQVVVSVCNGFIWGLLVAAIATGLTIIFGLMRIVNLAHGELYMLGAIATWFMVQRFGNVGFWLALAIIPVAIGVFGIFLERFLFRPIEKEETATIIVAIGLLYILQQVGLITYGGTPQMLPAPIEGSIQLSEGYEYPVFRLAAAAISVLGLTALWFFLFKTNRGLLVRASQQNRELALGMGIPTSQVFMLTFAIGAGFAAFAGVMTSPIVPVHFLMGQDVIVICLVVAIMGGLGSLKGTLVASLIIGAVEGIASIFVMPPEARILSLTALIVLLLFRPSGLYGRRE